MKGCAWTKFSTQTSGINFFTLLHLQLTHLNQSAQNNMMWFGASANDLLSKEWEFIKMSAPYLASEGARMCLSFVTILFAGNIDKAHLDGVGLANTLFTIVVLSLSQGYSYVFATFGPQLYGSSRPGELTTCLIKSLLQGVILHLILLGPFLNLVYFIDMLPNSGVYPTLNTGDMSENHDYRDIAVRYLRLSVPIEFLDYAILLNSSYFIIQGSSNLVYLVSAIMVAAHVLANYIFVSVLGLGVEGLAVAGIISRFLALIVSLTVCVVKIKVGSFPWNGINLNVLTEWKPMIKLVVSGAVFLFIKYSLLEVSTFCSQFVSMNSLSVIVILIQINSIFSSLALAVGLSSSTLIGKALAEANISDVKQFMSLTMINVFLEVVPGTIIFYIWRDAMVGMFTDDPEVIDLYCRDFWLVCVFFMLAHFHVGVNQGILTAFGEQAYVAMNMTWSCLLVGLPIVISTIFLTDLGLIGILLGWTTTKLILLLAGLIKLWRTDIDGEIEKSRLRVENSTYGSLDINEADKMFKNHDKESEEMETGARKEKDPHYPAPTKSSDMDDQLSNIKVEMDKSYDALGSHREVKIVVLAFALTAIWFLTLAGVSSIRDFH